VRKETEQPRTDPSLLRGSTGTALLTLALATYDVGTEPRSIALTRTPVTVQLLQGATGQLTCNVQRTNYEDRVCVGVLDLSPGVTATRLTAGDQQIFNLAATTSAAPGSHALRRVAAGNGAGDTVEVALTVRVLYVSGLALPTLTVRCTTRDEYETLRASPAALPTRSVSGPYATLAGEVAAVTMGAGTVRPWSSDSLPLVDRVDGAPVRDECDVRTCRWIPFRMGHELSRSFPAGFARVRSGTLVWVVRYTPWQRARPPASPTGHRDAFICPRDLRG